MVSKKENLRDLPPVILLDLLPVKLLDIPREILRDISLVIKPECFTAGKNTIQDRDERTRTRLRT